jgi:hypothetical protein
MSRASALVSSGRMASCEPCFVSTNYRAVAVELEHFETDAAARVWAETLFNFCAHYPYMEFWDGARFVHGRERTA